MVDIKKFISSYIGQIIIFVIFVKLILLFLGVFAYHEILFSTKSYEANFHYPKKEASYILPFKTWDAQHYLYLAEVGYKKGNESNRFFPLLPFTIRGLTPITKSPLVSGYFLSLIFSIGSGILIYKITILLTKNKEIAFDSVLFLFIFPSAFYLSLIYAESMFMFLALLFFYFLERKKLLYSLFPAILLPLVRPQGVFIVIPLFFYLFQYQSSSRAFSIPTFNNPIKFRLSPKYLAILAPFLGVAIYFLIMYLTVGSIGAGISGLSSLSNWNIRNITDPFDFLRNLLTTNLAIHGFQNSIIDRVFFVFFLSTLPFIYKKFSKPYFYFTLALGLVPLFGSFMSYTRYLLLAFPIYILLAQALNSKKVIMYKYIVIFAFIALQAVFFISHILNYWVS